MNFHPPPTAIAYSKLERIKEAPYPTCLNAFRGDVTSASQLPVDLDPRSDVLFCGRLKNAHGERLVIVEAEGHISWDSGTGPCICLNEHVVRPCGLFGSPDELWAGQVRPTSDHGEVQAIDMFAVPVTIYSGHADRASPADFSIDVFVEGQRSTLRGHLTDDDRITLHDDSADGVWQRLWSDSLDPLGN